MNGLSARSRHLVWGLTTLLVGCGGGTEPPTPPPPTVSFKLIAARTAGVDGSPAAGEASYTAGTVVPYNFSAQSTYENLRVLVDGAAAPAAGTLRMDRDRTVLAFADLRLVVPALVQPEVEALAGQLHGLVTGATRPMDVYRAVQSTIRLLSA